jgi:HSP20 family protein
MPDIPFPRGIPLSVQDLRDEFDRLVDRVWHVGLNTAPLDGQDWAPAMDIVEEADRYRIRVEVPGLAAEDVQVSILDGALTVKGTKRPVAPAGDEHRYLRKECRFGGFCRRYELPGAVDEDNVTASCKNGVLEMSIPKKPEAQGRAVKVEFQE